MVRTAGMRRGSGVALGTVQGPRKRGISVSSHLRLVALKAQRAVQREQIKSLVRLNLSARRIHAKFVAEHGSAAFAYRTVVYHRRVIMSRAVGVLPRPRGRPRHDWLDEKISDVHSETPDISARAIAKRLEAPRETIREHLQGLGGKFKRAHTVPHALTSAQKRCRVVMAQKLLEHLRDKKKWPQTFTGDESWITFEQSSDGHWVFPGDPDPVRVAPQQGAEKCMLITFFSTGGFKIIDFLTKETTANAEYCCELFRTLGREVSRRPLWLHMDNAPPHRAKCTQMLLNGMQITTLPHPPYSPDLAPSDFWLFGHLKEILKGTRFTTADELAEAVRRELHNFKPHLLRRVYNSWIRRLQECIRNNGEYVEHYE